MVSTASLARVPMMIMPDQPDHRGADDEQLALDPVGQRRHDHRAERVSDGADAQVQDGVAAVLAVG
jgi:hypothetical protein